MKPDVTWCFTAKSAVTGTALKTELCRPVDADMLTMANELFDAGYRDIKLSHKEWEKWAWPGGYPIYYICQDAGCLCADCANKEIALTTQTDDPQWHIVAAAINYEDDDLVCDHCGKNIESAYGEPGGAYKLETDDSDDSQALASAGMGTDEDYGSAEDIL